MNISTTKDYDLVLKGEVDLDGEQIFATTRGGTRRLITRVTFTSTIRLGDETAPYITITASGHNVLKDGSRGADWSDRYPSFDRESRDEYMWQVVRGRVKDVVVREAAEFNREFEAAP